MKNFISKNVLLLLIMAILTLPMSAKTLVDNIYNDTISIDEKVPIAFTIGGVANVINDESVGGSSVSLTIGNVYVGGGIMWDEYDNNAFFTNVGYQMKANDKLSVIPNVGILWSDYLSLNYGCVFRYSPCNKFIIDANITNNFIGIGLGMRFGY